MLSLRRPNEKGTDSFVVRLKPIKVITTYLLLLHIVDSFEFQVGVDNFNDVKPTIPLSSLDCQQQCDERTMVILEDSFPEDSILSKINVHVKEIGTFRLLVRSF